jgi:hypothetical protein
MKRILYYRGCTINNHEKEQGLVIITPAQQKLWIKDAVSFDECKVWIDRNLVKLAIDRVFN